MGEGIGPAKGGEVETLWGEENSKPTKKGNGKGLQKSPARVIESREVGKKKGKRKEEEIEKDRGRVKGKKRDNTSIYLGDVLVKRVGEEGGKNSSQRREPNIRGKAD